MTGRITSTLAGLALVLLAACSSATRDTWQAALTEGQSALRRGDAREALRLVDAALPAAVSANDSVDTWQLRLLKADILIAQRSLDAARDIIDSAIPDTPKLAGLRGRQRYLDARLKLIAGEYAAAFVAANDARTLAPGDVELVIDADLLEGQAHELQGHWTEARTPLDRSLVAATRIGDRYRQLLAINNLGFIPLSLARYDEALTWYERGQQYSEFESATVFGVVMSNAGICLSRLGMFDRALELQQRAVAIQRPRGASRQLVEAVGSLGNTMVLKGDASAAVPHMREALDIATQAGLKRDAALWAVNLATVYASLGEWDRTDEYNALSRSLGGEQTGVKPAYLILNTAESARGRGDLTKSRTLYEQALAAADGAAPIVWTAQVGLAQVAVGAHRPDDAARHFDAALTTVEQTRAGLLKPDYRLAFLSQLIAFYQGYVDLLVDQGRSDRALELADSSRGRVLAEQQRTAVPARANAAAFQRVAARTKTTLLSYWLAPKRSFLWVVTGNGIRRVDLPPAAEIEKAVDDYRALIDNSMADPLKATETPGDRLYQMLLAPAALPRDAAVIIVPDGALHGINFETLPVPARASASNGRHYFIADAQVQVAPSLALLSVSPPSAPAAANPRLLLIGNPTPRAPEFPALGYAPAEMTSIVRHFPQDRVTAYDSARATPAVYRDTNLDRFTMIHFTAHATANVLSPLDSAVVLSGPDTAYKLYARDVADKPLTADLVTVSACRSAGERAYSGEGLVGFAWAFLRAGARRVVAGLWDVDDRSTAQLMDALYGGVQSGKTPAAALRAAKLSLIASGGQLARPYYWGPFQLFTVVP